MYILRSLDVGIDILKLWYQHCSCWLRRIYCVGPRICAIEAGDNITSCILFGRHAIPRHTQYTSWRGETNGMNSELKAEIVDNVHHRHRHSQSSVGYFGRKPSAIASNNISWNSVHTTEIELHSPIARLLITDLLLIHICINTSLLLSTCKPISCLSEIHHHRFILRSPVPVCLTSVARAFSPVPNWREKDSRRFFISCGTFLTFRNASFEFEWKLKISREQFRRPMD